MPLWVGLQEGPETPTRHFHSETEDPWSEGMSREFEDWRPQMAPRESFVAQEAEKRGAPSGGCGGCLKGWRCWS